AFLFFSFLLVFTLLCPPRPPVRRPPCLPYIRIYVDCNTSLLLAATDGHACMHVHMYVWWDVLCLRRVFYSRDPVCCVDASLGTGYLRLRIYAVF
ncbi:hypothetical protein DFH11DRAFT_1615974, partial [Phellopilus nigrolimitatus]